MRRFAGLSTERLAIRLLDEGDATEFLRYRNLPEVYRYQAWLPGSMDEVRAFCLRNSTEEPFRPSIYTQFAISRKEGDLLIGDIGVILSADGAQAEIGFTPSPGFTRMGYATEAVSAVLGYLFEEVGLHRVHASVDPDNTSSIRLLERLGFRLEGHLIKSYRMRGGWYDDCIFGMLEEEWLSKKDAAAANHENR